MDQDQGWLVSGLYEPHQPQGCPKPTGEKKIKTPLNTKLVLDSPPEAAVKATPDNTPCATPVKDSPLRHHSISKSGPAPHVKSFSFKSPGPASQPNT